jgi:hypothetical protein
MWARHEDIDRIWLHENQEYSFRLITNKAQESSFSFHLTTYLPHIDTVVEGDGEHETALYCLHGWARHIDLSDGREWEFRPGHAMYLPLRYRYRRIVGAAGCTVAVSCTPARE